MSDLTFVNVKGERVSIAELAEKHKPPPAASKQYLKRVHNRVDASESDGFAVVGFSPDFIAASEKQRAVDIKKWARKSAGERKGLKEPKPWDLELWMSQTKPKRVRTKPYNLPDAAEQCAELARKAGWLRVCVEELMKG